MSKSKVINLFWFRRDLRLEDNTGLFEALAKYQNVQPIFIFDKSILSRLRADDQRVPFIYQQIIRLRKELKALGCDLWVFYGTPEETIEQIFHLHQVESITTNHDYEPMAGQRDQKIQDFCIRNGRVFQSYKDQVIFEKSDILTDQKKPYTVYTPYKRKWLNELNPFHLKSSTIAGLKQNFHQFENERRMPSLEELGFKTPKVKYPEADLSSKMLTHYDETRDFPFLEDGTSHLGVHLRFGTLSIRHLVQEAKRKKADTWLSELIWREFFMQILWHYPEVEKLSFRPAYERVEWRNSKEDFQRWCEGRTGFPLVDAGMRELVETGHMHNRVRMVTASFLTKHLLIHWYQGERFFADYLLDFDLAANNGNWQWAAGTGCDAAPYFRIFNPDAQAEKFDPQMKYIKKWVPDFGTSKYPEPMIDHKMARERALSSFKKALQQ